MSCVLKRYFPQYLAALATLLLPPDTSIASTTAPKVSQQANIISRTKDYEVRELAGRLDHPWSLAFLPDKSMLVSERPGGLKIFREGHTKPLRVSGIPPVYAWGDGGLLGIALHPQFAENHYVYLCMSTGSENLNATSVIRARLLDDALLEAKHIFSSRPLKIGPYRYGCRLLFLRDHTLLVTLGDGLLYRDRVQNLDNHFGKTVRIHDDGSVPHDNPFQGKDGAFPEIYTLGHAHVQGITIRPGTDQIWASEHGPTGGDEINLLQAGHNYGWPRVTYGVAAYGASIKQRTAPGFDEPIFHWKPLPVSRAGSPSIAPSGIDFYRGDRFPGWQGNLFVASLAGKHLRRLRLNGNAVVEQQILLAELGVRIRDVRCGPEGYLYVLTDEDEGKLLRLEPPASTTRSPR